MNGVWIGTAHIKGIGGTVDLPLSSTIDGSLIIDPTKTTFKIVNVEGEGEIIASSFTDTLNFVNGTAIRLTVNSGSDSIIFDNTGVIKVSGTAGEIGVTATGPLGTGEITLTNLGVVSLLSTTALPSGRTEGVGININAANGSNIKITNTGVLSVSSVTASLTATLTTATGNVELENLLPAYPAFGNIVANAGLISAVGSSSGTTLNIAQGYGIALSTNNTTKTLTIAVDPVFDLRGSVFADDSTVMVDAVSGTLRGIFIGSVFTDSSTQIIDGNTATVYGNIEATTLRTAETTIALGVNAGQNNQGASSVAIGANAGSIAQGGSSVAIGFDAGSGLQGNTAVAIGTHAGYAGQGADAVALGFGAGEFTQGLQAVAIGAYAGAAFQPANTIILNASGSAVNGVAAQTNSFYVAPIRNATGANGVVQYDSTTREVTYSSTLGSVSGTFTGNIFTSLIDSADSSAITVTPAIIFSSDVTVENDLDITQRLRVRGGSVINLTELQSVVAASASFADFQARIAALV